MTVLDPRAVAAPFVLPCGVPIANRLVKAAMSETFADRSGAPNARHASLYSAFARGGVGLAITGNVMIDRRAPAEPGNVAIEDRRDLEALRAWARAATEHGAHVWVQLNHPGKQTPRVLAKQSVAPSAIPLGPELARFFAPPRALTEDEILELVERFARAAQVAKEAGFTGVELHAAHGFLISQFLSPLHNQRTDRWGGPLHNRLRFADAVVRATREAVGADFPIAVKLNSADFQRGGFGEEEAIEVAQALAAASVDLIEISGGTFEAPASTGTVVSARTAAREAYFLEFAEKLRARTRVPLLVTGGFRSGRAIEGAVRSGATDFVGLARALALDPMLPRRVLDGEDVVSTVQPLRTGIGLIDRTAVSEVTFYQAQLARIAAGRRPESPSGARCTVLRALASASAHGVLQRLAP